MKEITKFVAFDGREFDNAVACRKYEAEHAEAKLVGLTAEQLAAAVAREASDAHPDAIEIADAIEDLAKKIKEKRLGAGEFRRKPKADTPVADEPPASPAEAAE